MQQLAGRGAYLYARLGYDPMTDLLPVTQVNSAPLMLVVHPVVPAKSVPELIAYAKANPGKLNYGSAGIGSTPYLATELFKSMTGIDVVHVPYKGGAPALADLVAGQLSFMIENVPGSLPLVKDGRLQGARRHQPRTLGAGARPADHGRGRRAGLRDDRLERRVRRQRHAARDRRPAGARARRDRRARPRSRPSSPSSAPSRSAARRTPSPPS